MKRSVKSSRCRAAPAQGSSGVCPRRQGLRQACHTPAPGGCRLTTGPCHSPGPAFGHQSVLVSVDCGSQPPGCFNQRKVMKRLEGMIYGERLASEESRGRRENSLKVVEITEAAGELGGRWGGSCEVGALKESCWDGREGREASWVGGLSAQPPSAGLLLGCLRGLRT